MFSGSGEAAGYSKPVKATIGRFKGGPRDASAEVGPGNVDLLTGNYTVARTDVSIPAFSSSLEFARSWSTADAVSGKSGVLGPGWSPTAPVEADGGAEWQTITEFLPDAEEAEEGMPGYVILTDLEGYEYAFEISGSGFVVPPEASGWILSRPDAAHIAFADPAGNRTLFEKQEGTNEYKPVSVTQASGDQTKMVYEFVDGHKRLQMVLAPSPSEVGECNESNATTQLGCRALTFTYQPWGGQLGDRLTKVTYYGPSNASSMGSWEVANYAYDSQGRLTAEWDPRISPALKETYAYDSGGELAALTPPGEEPWIFEYSSNWTWPGEPPQPGPAYERLVAVRRASLLAVPAFVQTTIVYGVPLSGSEAPYDMSPSAVAQWGQREAPADATAVFPPDQEPSSPPSSYSRATVYYMNAEGQMINTATPSGGGTSAPSITTSEPDEHGNVVRELSAQNRLRALAAGSESVSKSHELETTRAFNPDGTEMLDEWGPLHEVRLESGEAVQARTHKAVEYDAGEPTPPSGTPWAHLPTSETVGARVPGQVSDADQRVTKTEYNWTLRKPTDTIIDPNGLDLRTHVEYDPTTGLPTETRLPANPGGGDAHTTKTIYYTARKNTSDGSCGLTPAWANLPCKVTPAAQPGTPGQPALLVKQVLAYSALGQPTEVSESAGGSGESRVTHVSYDAAGRERLKWQTGGGASVPMTQTLYSSSNGRPTTKRFALCGCDSQAVTATYDALGRVTAYEDADGNVSTASYDLLGRPVTTDDGKGTQTRTYDPTSGLLVKLEDSGAGTFTATYNADGSLTEETLPDGLVAKTTYDPTGEPVDLSYEKTTFCSTGCTWLDFSVERSATGQILNESTLTSTRRYAYDKAGRLVRAEETPAGGECTTRTYSYDQDSNRTSLTRTLGMGGVCNTSPEGTTQTYGYDAGDRLTTPAGITYDNFGRITSLPGEDAGGSTLTTSYYTNDMVASQSQEGITNSYELDAAMRQRRRVETGSKEATEVFHYTGGTDSPAWTETSSGWVRNITGIDGSLVATESSSEGVTFELCDLHGNIAGTVGSNPEAKELAANYEYNEFGIPQKGTPASFGWHGGKERRTQLPSGVIQMGVRSYVPEIGRFLSTDPVPGGSANAYDYANADPVNGLDISGEAPACSFHQPSFHAHRRNGHWEVKVQAWAHCGRSARNVHVKAVALQGSIHPAPGVSIPFQGLPKTGPSIACGPVGPKFACPAEVSVVTNADPPCNQVWPGHLEAMFLLTWQTSRGRVMQERYTVDFPLAVGTKCR